MTDQERKPSQILRCASAAFAGSPPLMMRADGGDLRFLQITTATTWSPVDDCLAYVQADGGEVPDELVVEDAGGGHRTIADATQPADVQKRQLTSDPAYRDEFPQFSPDFKQILFARMDAHDQWSLWLIPSAGGDPKQVVPKVDVASVLGSETPAWLGYYGTIPWHDVFDWWRPAPWCSQAPVRPCRID